LLGYEVKISGKNSGNVKIILMLILFLWASGWVKGKVVSVLS
jgi:hypothetical protein